MGGFSQRSLMTGMAVPVAGGSMGPGAAADASIDAPTGRSEVSVATCRRSAPAVCSAREEPPYPVTEGRPSLELERTRAGDTR